MSGYWEYRTKRGTFRIVPRARSFHPFFEDEDLGLITQLRPPWTTSLEGTPTFLRTVWTHPRAAYLTTFQSGLLSGQAKECVPPSRGR